MKSLSHNFIKRLKDRNEDALEYIINAYMPLVKTIATKILFTSNYAEIEECINDVFLLIWQNAHQFKGEEAEFKKWVGIITKTKAIDRYRQIEKRKYREQSEELVHNTASKTKTEDNVVRHEDKDAILMALSQLGELDCDIFIMKYYFELSNGEIAEQLGLSKAAVDNRLYRGKKELAKNLKLKELLV